MSRLAIVQEEVKRKFNEKEGDKAVFLAYQELIQTLQSYEEKRSFYEFYKALETK
jgi:hypothetical protein